MFNQSIYFIFNSLVRSSDVEGKIIFGDLDFVELDDLSSTKMESIFVRRFRRRSITRAYFPLWVQLVLDYLSDNIIIYHLIWQSGEVTLENYRVRKKLNEWFRKLVTSSMALSRWNITDCGIRLLTTENQWGIVTNL